MAQNVKFITVYFMPLPLSCVEWRGRIWKEAVAAEFALDMLAWKLW
jgi:hypothetical protein